jgi:hypothetical protein
VGLARRINKSTRGGGGAGEEMESETCEEAIRTTGRGVVMIATEMESETWE